MNQTTVQYTQEWGVGHPQKSMKGDYNLGPAASRCGVGKPTTVRLREVDSLPVPWVSSVCKEHHSMNSSQHGRSAPSQRGVSIILITLCDWYCV